MIRLSAALRAALGGVRYLPILEIPTAAGFTVTDRGGAIVPVARLYLFRAWFVQVRLAHVMTGQFNDKLKDLGVDCVRLDCCCHRSLAPTQQPVSTRRDRCRERGRWLRGRLTVAG